MKNFKLIHGDALLELKKLSSNFRFKNGIWRG